MTDIDTLYRLYALCTGVTTDSRQCAAGTMFVALRGANFNGNLFAATALENGCSYAVVDDATCVVENDPRYLLVDDTLKALQQLARRHRRTLGTPIIAITGTNGKTTTKELAAAVLSRKYRLLYTQGNLNNHIGVPLTLLRLTPEHDLAVVEMGASHPGDIRELVEIAESDYGLITNVGKAHLEGFGSLEGVIKTKGELYDYLRQRKNTLAFVYEDNPYLAKMAEGLTKVTYGGEEGAESHYVTGRVTGNSPYLAFEWQAADGWHAVQTALIGEYNFPNALAAVCLGRYFGVQEADIDHALAEYVPQNNRSQLKRTADNTLIIDAYNANPTSMRAAIGNFRNMQAERKLLILGDMGELGAESDNEHRKVVDYLKECNFEEVILVGSHFAALPHPFRSYIDAAALTAALQADKPKGRTILIKGSNYMKLSSVVEYL